MDGIANLRLQHLCGPLEDDWAAALEFARPVLARAAVALDGGKDTAPFTSAMRSRGHRRGDALRGFHMQCIDDAVLGGSQPIGPDNTFA